jgi:hypothetical protein
VTLKEKLRDFRDKLLDKMEWFGQELTRYWYIDLTIAFAGIIIFLIARKLKEKKDKDNNSFS